MKESPGKKKYLLIGIIIGIVIGVAATYLLFRSGVIRPFDFRMAGNFTNFTRNFTGIPRGMAGA